MKLIFLGTGGYHPNERRHTAGLMLPEMGLVFDAGTCFFRLPERLKTDALKIFLTHAHLDHICGLTYFLVPLLNKKVAACEVWGTTKTIDAVRNHLLAEEVFPLAPAFEYRTLGGAIVVGDAKLTYHAVAHPGGAIAYRLEWPDRSLAYVTDTTAPGDYLDFIRGVDVLIHECYFPDELAKWCEQTGHSHTTAVAELAKRAGVKRLYLTHIDPYKPSDDPIGLATAQAIFPDTIIAEDLMEIDF